MSALVTPAVRVLLVVNAATFVVQLLADQVLAGAFTRMFGLSPLLVARGAVWQPVTYQFLHGGLWHLLLNLLALVMFGGAVEERIGTRSFVGLSLVSGTGAGLVSLAVGWGKPVTVVGASGAVFGVLIAFAMLYPYRPVTLLLFFIVPVTLQARWLVAVYAWIEAMTLLSAGGAQGLAQVAHLAGLLFGWAWLKAPGWPDRLRAAAARRRFRRGMRLVREGRARRSELQEEVDRLLDKISRRGGLGGLSDAERRRLVEASEELRRL